LAGVVLVEIVSRESRIRLLATLGAELIRFAPEPLLVSGAKWLLRDTYPEGRDYLTTALLLVKKNLNGLAPPVRRAILNSVANVYVKGEGPRERFREQNGFEAPILIVISPTMQCNLRCSSCYAGEYDRSRDLGLDVYDRVIAEAEEMGVFFVVVSGGEPLVLGDELLEMIGRHPNIFFQIYTNGTLIDREMARALADAGNAYPCISVEGFEGETDARRGPGTFTKIIEAMENLRREGVIFGFSATATRDNNDLLVSREFIDFYRDRGCMLGWYFQYMPVGAEARIDLMPTPEQRIRRRVEIQKRRAAHDILLADFWNDGPLVGGCLAASRYLHVNALGEVEPCVFTHFAVDSIKEKSLLEVLKSEFFTRIRNSQPYDENLFRPCQIIDLPWVLRENVEQCGAHPTHEGAEAVLNHLSRDLDGYAEEYRRLADPLWETYGIRHSGRR
jgi:MoaA/NifB/PqqE/SkfB family radical SAM enzyme